MLFDAIKKPFNVSLVLSPKQLYLYFLFSIILALRIVFHILTELAVIVGKLASITIFIIAVAAGIVPRDRDEEYLTNLLRLLRINELALELRITFECLVGYFGVVADDLLINLLVGALRIDIEEVVG